MIAEQTQAHTATIQPHIDWQTANQRYLRAALDGVQASLLRLTGAEAPDPAWIDERLQEAARELPAPAALDTLCADFGLSPFERNLLLLCAGYELDGNFAPLCAAAQSEPTRPFPTFSLAMESLPDAHWSALAPEATLRRWRLIEVGSGAALVFSPLRIDERVLHYLLGVSYIDDRLRGLIERVRRSASLPTSHHDLVKRIVAAWSQPTSDEGPPVVLLCGASTSDKRGIAAIACGLLEWQMFVLHAQSLPVDPRELDAFTRLWEREAILSRAALLIDCDEIDGGDAARKLALRRFVEEMGGPLLLAVRERRPERGRAQLCLDIARPSVAEQRALWRQMLGAVVERANGVVDALAGQFRLNPDEMRSVAIAASDAPADALGDRLWSECRVQARPRLDELAQRVDARAAWPDLVLPVAQMQTLRELLGQVRQRDTVYEKWGYGALNSRGLGISALFAGASGTGKTLAAEVLANELRLDLYRIDLSQVVSKYIGETEKNLRRVFDAAEDGAAVLLFDEADALFGKRSEVKDSHDRYANIEVSYLLQRMEAYRGLAILTTNLKDALDSAFLRRIRFVVTFPFPNANERLLIWRRMFPTNAPVEGVDLGRLARLNLAGGNIRNIALNAAFLAADANQPLRMAHLLRAAQIEYAKLEKPLSASEVGDWL